MSTQCIHGFDTHTIESHTLLESFRVVLSTRIEYTHSFHQFPLWDASSIVAHSNSQIIFNIYLYPIARFHFELINRVVQNLFQEYINAVLWQLSVAQSTNVHAWTSTHMLHIRQVTDVIIGISNSTCLLLRRDRLLVLLTIF